MKRAWLTLVLASCAPPTKQELAAERTRVALAKLPTCVMRDTGSVNLLTSCTRLVCEQACCNTCSLRDALVVNERGSRSTEPGRARDVLELDSTMLDCEMNAVRGVLDGVTMAFDPVACVVR